ncbi:plasmid pRiA4b ORF-3 family protein [Asticcacaulis sp. EMRT-3]|uniref:plasmid pRiA4b ORF-3 family protein n=1 Tax=Asticcacaulis sp. EMRT-3 TaxID=3040349 RepID=UPI0024AFA2B7|nr:plasmid pRiA4b ORF-3 family protein [Asticcacaulis sp. EMRT-3]MDI7776602.1 plasmid pRiA4b ORF-3 family protein [Asticcacaulis sp. EMRT-3]
MPGILDFLSIMFERNNAVQIRISLDEITPEVWRRLVVPASWDLQKLHLAIQAAFNWWDSHLHEFLIGGLRYGDAEFLMRDTFEDECRVFDYHEVRLSDFARPGSSFTYVYDFGDNWQHTVVIEDFLTVDPPPKKATCISGARARPPEDVGGFPGYENFLEIMADPDHDEHKQTKRWCGGHFDPEWFDLAMVDKDVQNATRSNVRRRLHQPKPKAK